MGGGETTFCRGLRVTVLAGFLLIAGLSLIPGAMGAPGIAILSVPSDGSDQTWISGLAEDVIPADFAVVVYIRVGSGWWGPKPTFAAPATAIRSDGFWDAVFVTGGYDDEATQFAAYLVPRDVILVGVMPPELYGTATLPASLSAYPHTVRDRPSAAPLLPVAIEREGTELVGLDFGPYLNGERPGATVLSEATIRQRLEAVAGTTTWIRTFGVDGGLERVGPIAHTLGKKTAIGVWLGPNLTANRAQLQALVQVGRGGGADLLIVGSETLERGDLSEQSLVAYMQWVRSQVPGVPVATADTYTKIQDSPSVVEASDLLLVNIYPYWDGVSIDNAVPRSRAAYLGVTSVAKGRPVAISEMGWPDGGAAKGEAVPSTTNAIRYLHEATSWAHAAGIPYFYFEAFDEGWKATDSEGAVGAHWGIWDGNLQLKQVRLPLEQEVKSDFSATPITGFTPLTVRFSDTSAGAPTTWSWSFGDGTMSTLQHPSHTYTVAGTYTVNLTVMNAEGSDDEKKIGYINVRAPVVMIPGGGAAPTDTNGDGMYDDLNGNSRKDFADVVLYFNLMSWIAANEPRMAFDYNANGRIDFADVVWLFNNL